MAPYWTDKYGHKYDHPPTNVEIEANYQKAQGSSFVSKILKIRPQERTETQKQFKTDDSSMNTVFVIVIVVILLLIKGK